MPTGSGYDAFDQERDYEPGTPPTGRDYRPLDLDFGGGSDYDYQSYQQNQNQSRPRAVDQNRGKGTRPGLSIPTDYPNTANSWSPYARVDRPWYADALASGRGFTWDPYANSSQGQLFRYGIAVDKGKYSRIDSPGATPAFSMDALPSTGNRNRVAAQIQRNEIANAQRVAGGGASGMRDKSGRLMAGVEGDVRAMAPHDEISSDLPAVMRQVLAREMDVANQGALGIAGIEAVDEVLGGIRTNLAKQEQKAVAQARSIAAKQKLRISKASQQVAGTRAARQAGKVAMQVAGALASAGAPVEASLIADIQDQYQSRVTTLELKKAELIEKNLLSRRDGVQGVKEVAGLMMDYINNRTWDKSLEKYMRSWSPERTGAVQKELIAKQGQWDEYQARLGAQLSDWLDSSQYARRAAERRMNFIGGLVPDSIGFKF